MSKKKIIGLVAGFVAVAAVTALVFFFVNRNTNDNPGGADNVPTQSAVDNPSKPCM